MTEPGRARGRAATWPPRRPAEGAGPVFPRPLSRPRFGPELWDRVAQWLAEDSGPGRLIPWLPVAFASGIVVKVERLESRPLNDAPERVRLSVRKGLAPPVGAFIELKAHLSPPRAPLRPGGYDLARDLYFQGIGATGLALGEIKITPAPRR